MKKVCDKKTKFNLFPNNCYYSLFSNAEQEQMNYVQHKQIQMIERYEKIQFLYHHRYKIQNVQHCTSQCLVSKRMFLK